MVRLTLEDLSKLKCYCLKDGNKGLLGKILEMEDYCRFHSIDGLELQIDWRKDREEEA